MSFTKKFNKGKKFDIVTNDFQYVSLEELYNAHGAEMVYPLRAIYINRKSKFGDAPVFATDDCFVNIPSHMLDISKEILTDEEAIEEINKGKVGFEIYPYTAKTFNCNTFGVRFVDM